jgi:hypothetical protein
MMFGSVLEHFGNLQNVKRCKTCVTGMNALFWITELAKMVSHQMHQLYCIGHKIFLRSVLEHFVNLLHVKRKKTCVSVLNALIWGTEVAKIVSHQMHSFNSLGPIKMFGSVLDHFRNIQNVKRDKTWVLCFNALFRGTEVAKNGFTPNGSILLH